MSEVREAIAEGADAPTVRVWDLPVRVSHWVLAAAVATCWWTGEEGMMDIHLIAGYVVLGTVLFRLAWGLVGSDTARFGRFPLGPGRLLAYLSTFLDRRAPAWLGHNPAGAAMVVFMLAYFGSQAVLGLVTSDGLLVDGPYAGAVAPSLVERASDLHRALGEYVPLVVGLHVAAVLFYLGWKRQALLAAIVTGRRRADPTTGAANGSVYATPRFASNARALAIAITVALLVVTLVRLGRSFGGASDLGF